MIKFIILIIFSSFAFCETPDLQPLIVGMELSYPPFEMIDPQGNPIGVSVDIAKALGRYLNREIKIDNIPFIGLVPALKTGKIDLIISSMTITKQREESINFSIPYLTTGLSLLVNRKSNIKNIKDADQAGKVIVVKWGTSGHLYAFHHIMNASVITLDKESSCVLEVVQGKADAFIYDQFSVFTNWQKHLTTTYALLIPFQLEKWGIGVRKENMELLEEVNQFIKAFKQAGGFEKLGNKYLLKEKIMFKKLHIPFVF